MFRCRPLQLLSCSLISFTFIFRASFLRSTSGHLHFSSSTIDRKTKNGKDIDSPIAYIRNIGIAAHIDAGKTTTTERMLYYTGETKRIGNVDSCNTTTDFMSQETERGITIQSAAVTMHWKGCDINLIDTPGHVDFAIEVERSLRVVDGMVALFDAAVGVQAQSYTVLNQAKRYNIPVIGFINKMDKSNANFNRAVDSMVKKLNITPLLLQVPLTDESGDYQGSLDLVNMQSIRYEGVNGDKLVTMDVHDDMPAILRQCREHRRELLATLSKHDELLTEVMLLQLEAHNGDENAAEDSVSAAAIRDAVRRQTLNSIKSIDLENRIKIAHDKNLNEQFIEGGTMDPLRDPSFSSLYDLKPIEELDISLPQIVPIFCGAARRNMGIQPLLDAINEYLPSPLDRYHYVKGFTQEGLEVCLTKPSNSPTLPTLALAFKVVHVVPNRNSFSAAEESYDTVLEPLVFFRVYTGCVSKGIVLSNRSNGNRKENVKRLFVVQGGSYHDVDSVGAGGIGAAFLHMTSTGDTLYGYPGIRGVQQEFLDNMDLSRRLGEAGGGFPEIVSSKTGIFTLEGIQVNPPVISYAIEAGDTSQANILDQALRRISLEDPSIRVHRNQQGQVVISGMGELQLEIVMSRLEREYHLECRLLRAIIEYRETISNKRSFENMELKHKGLSLYLMSFDIVSCYEDGNDERVSARSEVRVVLPEEVKRAFLDNEMERLGFGNKKKSNKKSVVDRIKSGESDNNYLGEKQQQQQHNSNNIINKISHDHYNPDKQHDNNNNNSYDVNDEEKLSEMKKKEREMKKFENDPHFSLHRFERIEPIEHQEMKLEQIIRDLNRGLKTVATWGPIAALPLHGFEIVLRKLEKKSSIEQQQLNDPQALVNASRIFFSELIRTYYGQGGYNNKNGERGGLQKRGIYSDDMGILEPMMLVQVSLVEESYIGEVISLLSSKNANSIEIDESDQRTIMAVVAMRNLTHFNGDLKRVSKGQGYFWPKLAHYRPVTNQGVKARILSNLGVLV